MTDKAIEAALCEFWANFQGVPTSALPAMRAAIAAYEQAMWRPIKEAPKDGTRVLLRDNRGVIFIGEWSEEAQFGECNSKPGWRIFECEDSWYSFALNDATHYRQLPPPPGKEG